MFLRLRMKDLAQKCNRKIKQKIQQMRPIKIKMNL